MTVPLLVNLDTSPVITAVITNDATGTPLDLTDCQVFFQLRRTDDRRFLINAACEIVDETAGEVEYTLTSDDLDFSGTCSARFLVIFQDAKRQHTVPALDVTVEAQ